MRALLTAVIAAIEAAAVALAVFAAIGVPAVLVWWLEFDLAAEPTDLVSVIAALWQMVHLVPMQVTVTAQAALALGLAPAALAFTLSLAPLTLTLGTVLLAYRSGTRSAGRGGAGAWGLVGGIAGFAAAAGLVGALAGGFTVATQMTRVAVPAAVYAAPLLLGFVLRAARDDHDWWDASVRSLQQGLSRATPTGAAALPDRAAEVFRLTAAALAALLMLGTLGFAAAIVIGYVDIISLTQSLQLDAFGALMLFVLQLAFLPTAWIWSISWFAGSGFAVGAATSVTPFDTLLGPLPVLPLFGAIPSSWGWVGGLAPVIVVVIGTVLGGLAGGRPLMRRASSLVSAVIPVLAAVLAGLVVALACVLASGALGPGRLEANGPGWWQTGGLIALEMGFGMSLGVFARRFDVARLRAVVPAALRDDGENSSPSLGGFAGIDQDQDLSETLPLDPLSDVQPGSGYARERDTKAKGSLPWQRGRRKRVDEPAVSPVAWPELGPEPDSDDQPTVEVEPVDPHYSGVSSQKAGMSPEAVHTAQPEPESEPEPRPEPESAPEPTPDQAPTSAPDLAAPDSETEPAEPGEPAEPADAVDPLLKAFSWDADAPDAPTPEESRDWRSRMRSKWGRD